MFRAFLAGFAYEFICAAWVTRVAAHDVAMAGVAGVACAGAVVVGLGDAQKQRRLAVAYVLGCGVGSAAGAFSR